MDSVTIILFLCIAFPLLLSLAYLEQEDRILAAFLVLGIVLCLCASALNELISRSTGWSSFFMDTTCTPVTEEVIKALPVLLFAFLISDQLERLIQVSMAIGIGFAILETTGILVRDPADINLLWAVTHVFGAGLMHGICTAAVGIGVSFVHKKRKLFYTGTFALLVTAITYHGIFNLLALSAYPIIGYLLPAATYLPILIMLTRSRREKEARVPAAAGGDKNA